jgi:S-adenosylmethionine hydrolase
MGGDLTLFTSHYVVEINDTIIQPVKYYAQAVGDRLCCLVNSSGYLELFMNKGNAAAQFGISKDAKIVARSL